MAVLRPSLPASSRPSVCAICTCFVLLGFSDFGQSVVNPGQQHVEDHGRLASLFEAGDTNAPLLAMDWSGERGIVSCRVTQSGKAYSTSSLPRDFPPHSTNRVLLEKAIGALPESANESLPEER